MFNHIQEHSIASNTNYGERKDFDRRRDQKKRDSSQEVLLYPCWSRCFTFGLFSYSNCVAFRSEIKKEVA